MWGDRRQGQEAAGGMPLTQGYRRCCCCCCRRHRYGSYAENGYITSITVSSTTWVGIAQLAVSFDYKAACGGACRLRLAHRASLGRACDCQQAS